MAAPYFHKLSQPMLSDEVKDRIASSALKALDKFVSYVTTTEKHDGSNYYLGPILNDESEIQSIVKSCSLRCVPALILHYPHTKIPKHTDEANKRNTVLINPLLPKKNYTPTWFWDPSLPVEAWHDETLQPVATIDFSDRLPVLFNTQLPHSLESGEEIRMNLQFCFDEPFDIVYQRLLSGTLFKK